MQKKKVLIVIADVGNGHRSAANAMTAVYERDFKDQYDVRTVDLFKLADVEPYNSSDASYALVSQNSTLEAINNVCFKLTNMDYVYNAFNWYTIKRLYDESEKIIEEEKPDIVISAHPIVSMVLGQIKKKQNNFKYVVVITDLVTMLRGWADANADLVFSPTTEAVNTLVRFGVDVSKIEYPLFPINPNLANSRPREEILKELGFNDYMPVVVITGGGVGGKSIEKAIGKLLIANENLQVVVIAGKLESLQRDLEYRYGSNPRLKVLGYVNNIQDYFSIADVVVAKPGPATVLELELFDKKVILTKKVGEQEIGNIDYALRNPKFRYIGTDWDKLEPTLNELLEMKPRESKQLDRRSFDECKVIVDEINKLV